VSETATDEWIMRASALLVCAPPSEESFERAAGVSHNGRKTAPSAIDPSEISPDEQALLTEIYNGDEGAFQLLFETYVGSLYQLAYHYVQSAEVARDVVQDVFVDFWDHRTSLTIHKSVSGYLARATRNKALNLLRHERTVQGWATASAREAGEPITTNEGSDEVDAKELVVAYRRALLTLSPRMREVFLLHRDHAMSYRGIAALLGIAEQTVSNHVSRALVVLRTALEEWL